ncbi:MAG: metallophosphoesterase [Bacilli bacterium]|nr:metallophosphoesterase [Bacilli bacterium]
MNIFKRIVRIFTYFMFVCCIIGFIFCGMSSDQLDFIEYKFMSDKVSQDMTYLVISDYHHRSLNFKNGNIIDKLKEQGKVDYVFFTGDLIDTHTKSLDDAEALFNVSNEISKNGCYFVTGNHEEYAPLWDGLQTLMDEKGVNYLNDEDVKIGNFHLFGLQDARFKTGGGVSFKAREEATKKTLDEKFKPLINPKDFNLLLVHRPENFKLIDTYGFNMVIAGHTHGGQIKLGNWIPGDISQEVGDYMGGEYTGDNGTKLYVSRGLGYSAMIPLRINCNPEILKITISK